MSEFGHFHASAAGAHIDTWGAGPFMIEINGIPYRFEDSDRFGPMPVDADGELTGFFEEDHPFWPAWQKWKDQGRRVAEDDMTCVVDEVAE